MSSEDDALEPSTPRRRLLEALLLDEGHNRAVTDTELETETSVEHEISQLHLAASQRDQLSQDLQAAHSTLEEASDAIEQIRQWRLKRGLVVDYVYSFEDTVTTSDDQQEEASNCDKHSQSSNGGESATNIESDEAVQSTPEQSPTNPKLRNLLKMMKSNQEQPLVDLSRLTDQTADMEWRIKQQQLLEDNLAKFMYDTAPLS